jgi:hypothetical protein
VLIDQGCMSATTKLSQSRLTSSMPWRLRRGRGSENYESLPSGVSGTVKSESVSTLRRHVHECGMGKVPFPCYLPFSPRPEVVLLVVRVAAVAGSSGDLTLPVP